jgi:two-component system response regulator YesN
MYRLLKRVSNKTTFRLKLLVAASLLAIIPVLLMGVITYFVSVYNIKQEIGKSNQETMFQIQQRIDDKLITLDKAVLQHAFNPTVNEFLESYIPYEDARTFDEITSILNSLEVLVDDVNSAYMFLTEQELVVSPNKGLFKAEKLDPRIRESIKDVNEPFYWLDYKTESSVPRGGSHIVTLVRRIPVNSSSPFGYLIINLNDRAFFEVLSEVKFGQSGELLIMTPSGNIFSDWNKSLLEDNLESYKFITELEKTIDEERMFTEKIHSETMLINYLQSPYNGWKYISVVPMRELTAQSQWIKNTTVTICLILIFTSLVAAILLSRRFYRVIHNVIEQIKEVGKVELSSSKRMDEFGFIRHYFETINSQNDLLNERIRETRPFIRNNFIQRVLTEPMEQEEIEERFSYYEITQNSSYYTVMSIEIDNLEERTVDEVNLLLDSVITISDEVASRFSHGMAVKMQKNQVSVIVNHSLGEGSINQMGSAVYHIADEIYKIVRTTYNLTITIGIGNCHQGVENIQLSYSESLESLKYRLVKGTNKVIFIGQIQSEESNYKYPIEIEKLIVKHLKLGDLDKINELVDKFIISVKNEERQNYRVAIQGVFQLITVTLKELNNLDPKNSPYLFSYNLYEKLSLFQTMEDIAQWLKGEVYPRIIEHILTSRDGREQQIMNKALDYIHKNYEKDLTQPTVAELLSIPPSQFSAMFKKVVGMTFTDYVITYRMEKAKELLSKTELKIIQIANRLCYNNSQNFSRIFKKINGVTPREYRDKSNRG